MIQSTSPTDPRSRPCKACSEPVEDGYDFHDHCVRRLLDRQRHQRGASMVEYVMLLAFVAVIGIIGLRAVGPRAAAMFDVDRLDLGPVATEVMGVSVVQLEIPPVACQDGSGSPAPICPE